MRIIYLSAIFSVFFFSSTLHVAAMDEERTKSQLSTLPQFPVDLAGHKINPQDYSITGKTLKTVLRNSLTITEGLTDQETLFGFGVTGTNLREYGKILDDSVYLMKVLPYQVLPKGYEWIAEGFIPNTEKNLYLK